MKRMKSPPHPGDFIRTELFEAKKISITEAAKRLYLSRSRLANVLNRRTRLSIEMALRFEREFKIDADTLCHMQTSYDLAKRRRENKKDLADARRIAKEDPGPLIPWKEVKKQFGVSSRKELAKEARRQSRMLRDDPEERELLEAWEKTADHTDWKC
jgi:addiction module HigA family antidote